MTSARVLLADELRWAQRELADAGVASAGVDAQWLASWVLAVPRGRLVVIDDIDGNERDRFRAAVRARARRIPLQHIVGRAAFGPVELAVGPGVFIPRPETEFLVEWAVARLAGVERRDDPIVIDMCSGSGALAIAIATMVPDVRVVAVERSDDALKWLRRNVAEQPDLIAERIEVRAGDITDPGAIPQWWHHGTADLVVSNPPYVPTSSAVEEEVRHDPESAVFGGTDGMSVIDPMIGVIATVLRPGGDVGIEHDDTASALVCSALRGAGMFDDVTAHDDLAGRSRFVTARRARMVG